VEALESQLAALREQQAALRQQLREARKGGSEIGKLQAKLEKQFAEAKWTAQQIHALQPDWDDVGFYKTVTAKQPMPRGRRPRTATAEPQA
jgi:chromosome segregation ATPase